MSLASCMPGGAVPPSRVRARADWLAGRLTSRDWAILQTLLRVHLATGAQLERLHFTGLSQSGRIRRRVLKRLTDARAVVFYAARIGGEHGGSGQRVYALDPAALVLLRLLEQQPDHPMRSGNPGYALRIHHHTLTVTELYVRLIESATAYGYEVAEFATEPACWWPPPQLSTGLPSASLRQSQLRPDAFAALARPEGTGRRVYRWWIEADLATERFPVMRGKFTVYTEFAQRGQPGPGGVIPRVLVTTPDQTRCAGLRRVLARLGEPAGQLIHITTFDAAVATIAAPINTLDLFGEDAR